MRSVARPQTRMENKIFLGKYQISVDENGAAVELARAAGGVTYKGHETESGREVALEVLSATSLKTAVRERLEAEAAAARQITHINIPALYDFGIEGDQIIYVSEYFDGTSTGEWVAEHGPMAPSAALRVALQVVGALGAMAFHKIVHHAINPANVVIIPGQTPDGGWPLVKVLHFIGVSPAFAASDEATAHFDGSVRFASPEQLHGGIVDFRSEIYSLGCTMWFLLTGAPPLIAPGGPLAVETTKTGLAVEKLNGIPKKVRRLLAQMLSVNPSERPRDPLAFYRQIQDCLAQVERREAMTRKFGVPAISLKAPRGTPARPIPVKALALAAMLLTIATLAALILPGRIRANRSAHGANRSEPIGVQIGVPDATVASAPIAEASNIPPTTETNPTNSLANSSGNNAENVPKTNAVNPAPAIDSTKLASVNKEPPLGPQRPEKKIEREQPALVARENTPESDHKEVAAAAEGPRTAAHAPDQQPPPIERSNASPEVRRPERAPENQEPVAVQSVAIQSPNTDATKSETNTGAAPKASQNAKHSRKHSRVAKGQTETDEGISPPGTVRARLIGTTPDGEWIFGLPSSQTGVAALPSDSNAQPRRRHRRHEIVEPPPQVLPALPPDDE